jgi:4-hydroxyphenylpyruvate dioxygenase
VQHIAFGTADIFNTARALQANGFSFLKIPSNYYDDLRARFTHSNIDIERLREHNILYDRDERGDYFQLYSPVFGKGFFLEVVQRALGYTGYGAPNAIFRIAAQRRLLGRLFPY